MSQVEKTAATKMSDEQAEAQRRELKAAYAKMCRRHKLDQAHSCELGADERQNFADLPYNERENKYPEIVHPRHFDPVRTCEEYVRCFEENGRLNACAVLSTCADLAGCWRGDEWCRYTLPRDWPEKRGK
jgi:hypothetical protein